ncbi:MAG TPA: hypothetical protein VLM85_32125, partial [Polyangiaceae bacterium]|nr:hypothetical protein [Polyangiaceae bacterium]
LLPMQDGYHDVPAGKLANVVTYLEIRAPVTYPNWDAPEFSFRHVPNPDLDWYRHLFRAIGEPWLWFSRLRMNDEELQAVIGDPAVDIFALAHEGVDQGLLEFDRDFVWGDEWIEFDSQWSTLPEIKQLWVNVFAWVAPQGCPLQPQ